jgi:flagellar FliL protein
LSLLDRVLAALAILVATVIVSVSVWAFASGHARPGRPDPAVSAAAEPVPESTLSGQTSHDPVVPMDGLAMFSDIGPLRARTADSEPATIVVEPVFPYDADDIAFREELVQKSRMMRTVILEWFASRTLSGIRELGEESVKAALIKELNGCFVLGKLDSVYFEEYMILD